MDRAGFSVRALIKGVIVIGAIVVLGLGVYRWWPRDYGTFDLSSIGAIDTDEQHTLILLNDGTLWGIGNGQYGQLGITASNPLIAKQKSLSGDRYTDRPVKIMSGVVQAEAGLNFSMALKSDNTLWGFGSNIGHELGIETSSTTEHPGVGPTKLMDDVAQIASQGMHSLVLKNDGSLWGFGRNLYGELGIKKNTGSYEGLLAPEKIMDDVARVFCGARNSFVLKTDNSLWSMGLNAAGELGFAPEQETNFIPQKIANNVVAVAAYEDHTLLLQADGTVLGMGSNSSGQLGLRQEQASTPTVITNDAKGIAVGRAHSLILKNDGSLWGLGDNSRGQLGSINVPELRQLARLQDSIKAVYAAHNHTLALTDSGELLAWGANDHGQIGLPGFFLAGK